MSRLTVAAFRDLLGADAVSMTDAEVATLLERYREWARVFVGICDVRERTEREEHRQRGAA